MTPQDIEALVERMVVAWNGHDIPGFLQLLTEDVVWSDPGMPEPARGRGAVQDFCRNIQRAFPDFHYSVRRPVCVSADCLQCAIPWRITATHLAEMSPPGFAPTGRRAELEGVDLLEFADRRVRRIESHFNPVVPAGQLLSLRLIPSPGSLGERLLVRLQRSRAWWLRSMTRPEPMEK